MIEIIHVSKHFDDIRAVSDLSITIPSGRVFGLVGTNGAGKSTLLRMAAGVLRPDTGEILVDGAPVYEHPETKQRFFHISDESWFFPNAVPDTMADYYALLYPAFSRELYRDLMDRFGLERKRQIRTFSKGMKKQLSVILGLSCRTDYLFCDETFDGLDPVMRQGVKGLFAEEMAARSFTPVIASHNLRELEDICDRIGLLHEGGVLLDRQLDDLKLGVHKIQCVIPDPEKEKKMLERVKPTRISRQGSLMILTVTGNKDELLAKISQADPVFSEILPLSFEEVFIEETKEAGYEIKHLFS